jgi:geranylgeranyl pyrophosphate synthase
VEQRAVLSQVLGNEDATPEQCDEVRRIFKATGALDYAKDRLGEYEVRALQALEDDSAIPPAFADYLRRLGEYLLHRKA